MRLLLLACLVLTACVDTRLPVTNGRILTAGQFDTTVAGNLYTSRDFSIAIRRGGTYSGRQGGQDVAGTWAFSNGQLCVTRSEPAPLPTDCQIWTVRGNAVTVTRNSGEGPRTTYLVRFPLPPSYEQRVGLAP